MNSNSPLVQFFAKAIAWLLKTFGDSHPVIIGTDVRAARNWIIATFETLAAKAELSVQHWEVQCMHLAKAKFRIAVAKQWWWCQLYRLITVALLAANVLAFYALCETYGAEGAIPALWSTAKAIVATSIDWAAVAFANFKSYLGIA